MTVSAPATLDDLLPDWHFREGHERRITASPVAVWSALQELRLGDLRLAGALMDLRSLPGRMLGAQRPAMVTGRFLEEGPVPVLHAQPGRAVVAGGVVQPWKLFGGDEPPELDGLALLAFDQPGWVKVGMDFVLEPDGGGTRLTTETRVQATDPATRRRFGRYWLVIRAGSGLIRRDLLRAVAQAAEARDASSA